MILNPKYGIDKLLFGMKQNDVVELYGNANKKLEDDDDNIILLFNKEKLRLTFYKEENYRLGYIISSNDDLTLLGNKIIGQDINEVKKLLPFTSWEQEDFDSTENHFNESNWITLQAEFNEIIRIEIGAIINDKDEFEFKFK